jgi:16S rRNA (cytosine1402-N4)-methyltransferase
MSFKEHPPQLDVDNSHQLHVPVLLDATLDILSQKGENYLDLTAGYGGHAKRFLEKTENLCESVLVDRDDYAIERLKSLFIDRRTMGIVHTDFVSLPQSN